MTRDEFESLKRANAHAHGLVRALLQSGFDETIEIATARSLAADTDKAVDAAWVTE